MMPKKNSRDAFSLPSEMELLRRLNIGSWYCKREGLLHLSSIAAGILGLPGQGYFATTALSDKVVGREMALELENSFKNLLERKTSFRCTVAVRTAHSHERWLDICGWTSADVAPNEEICMGSIRDINEEETTRRRLARIYDNLPGAVFRYELYPDGSDKLIYLNDGSTNLWGIPAEKAMQNATLIWDLCDARDIAAHRNSVLESARTMQPWFSEYRITHAATGELRWMCGRGIPHKRPDGTIVWDSVIVDITAEKKLMATVEKRERFYKGLIENAHDGTLLFNDAGMIKYATPAVERILGYTAEECLSLSAETVVHQEDYDKVKQIWNSARNNPKKVISGKQVRVRKKNGEWRWVEAVFTNLLNDASVNGIVENFKDISSQKYTELALRRSEERYRMLIENQSNFILITDPSGRIEYANKKAVDTFGKFLAHDTLRGASILQMMAQDERERLEKEMQLRQWAEGEMWRIETQMLTVESPFIVEWDISKFNEDAVSQSGYLQWVGFDVSLRHKYLETLRQSRQKFHQVFMQSADAMLIIDAKTELFADCNPAALEMLQLKNKKDVIGKAPATLSPLRQADGKTSKVKAREMIALAHRQGCHRFEWLHRSKKRNTFPVEVSLTPFQTDTDKYLLTVWRDITERKQMEMALAASEERYRLTLANSSDIITLVNAEGTIEFESEAIVRILGYGQDEFIGRSVFEFVHPEDVSQMMQVFQQNLAIPGKVVTVSYRILHKEGHYVHMESSAINQLYNPSIRSVIIASRDITERTHHLLAIEAQNEQLREITRIQSHEVRAPLSNIKGLIEVLRISNFDPDEVKALSGPLMDSVERFEQIIREITERAEEVIKE
jgi:PAS domain S-box-containing protein